MNKKTFGHIVILGSVWGLSECALGAGLKACASSISGSVMTAAALFFMAAAWVSGRKAVNVALLITVVILFKMFDALLLGLPLRSGAIANPIFAFILEGAGFLFVTALLPALRGRPEIRGVFRGGASALIAVATFPLVKFATGIPACVVAGSTVPLAWAYAPLAVGLSMWTVPIGLKTAMNARAFTARPSWRVSAAVILCLALMTVVRAISPA
jgi:hypothetical protein